MRSLDPRRRLLVTSALVAALAAAPVLSSCGSESAQSTSQASGTAKDEAAVRGLLDQINAAWARGDATEYASFHTSDADLIDFRGVHAVGRKGIVDFMQPAFDTVLSGTHVEAEITDFRFLTPEVAIFHTEGEVVPTGAYSIQTWIATKTDERWRIAAFQNTRIQEATAE